MMHRLLGGRQLFSSFSFSHSQAFGTPDAGEYLGHADPMIGLGYDHVTGQIGVWTNPDPKGAILRIAVEAVLA
jgi:hypothetical protein